MDYLTNSKLLDDAMNHISETVLINGKPQKAVVTTAYLGQSEKRHISSLEPFKAGDYVEHRGQTYLVMEETETKRHNKYRSTMEAVNYSFEVRDFLYREIVAIDPVSGRPQYKNHYSDPYDLHGVFMKTEKKFETGFQINLVRLTFMVYVQENETTLEHFEINSVFDIKGKNMQVAVHDRTHNGLLGVLFLQTGQTPPY